MLFFFGLQNKTVLDWAKQIMELLDVSGLVKPPMSSWCFSHVESGFLPIKLPAFAKDNWLSSQWSPHVVVWSWENVDDLRAE